MTTQLLMFVFYQKKMKKGSFDANDKIGHN